MSSKSSNSRMFKSNETEVDRFIKESCKSFKECNIKNNARRNSLQKKTLGIESERRLASANLSREERQLREQLKVMNIEKMKNNLMHNLREHKTKKNKKNSQKEGDHHAIPTEPYPITFRTQTPSPVDIDKQLSKEHKLYLIHRGRRQSKEFEDLPLNTRSGTLLHADSDLFDNDEMPRRRVHSMSHPLRQRSHTGIFRLDSRSGTPSPKASPDIRRKIGTPRVVERKRGQNSSGSSKESLDDMENINSLDDLHWIGEPEAIHSVRRPRKTVEEQELETELHKLKMT